ncbi:histidinol-phosphate transaminase [Hugenholtzia roseola]|uniref:histidinol-phosphate transaminase n=1 Tax=Hugenholtzia roseola TaxID=1002 RepID=UPI0003F65A82|nr:histidinol-phosphate transaminase [Hugenholtzia roseola]
MKKFDLSALIRPHLLALAPYSSARQDFKGVANVFLDANENPYSLPFELGIDEGYNRYPDPLQVALKKKIGKLKGIAPEHIFLGNGSDEPIDLLLRLFCQPQKDEIIITPPTYGMYAVSAAIQEVGIKKAYLKPDFSLDVAEIFRQVSPQTKLIFLCSPNNPTGNLLAKEDILQVLENFEGIVVVDEAYIDFAAADSFLPLLAQYPNLVVLQTFSKAWGLAALRLGMAYASAELITFLNKIKPPYNINLLTQNAVSKALDKENEVRHCIQILVEERKKLENFLYQIKNQTGVIAEVYPSAANFILFKTNPDYFSADTLYQKLTEKGIVVRNRSREPLCQNALRLSVGSVEENRLFCQVLEQLSQ